MQDQIDLLVREFFSAFDNRAGRKMEPAALRSLFIPSAVIVKNTESSSETMTVDAFIQPRQVLLENGSLVDFHEWEVDATTFIFGGIACRTLRYAKEGTFNGAPYSGEGMKSMHFAKTAEGWRITAIIWQDAEPGLPIAVVRWLETKV